MIKILAQGMARVGKIVIGERGKPTPGKSASPVKFDHFVVKTLNRGPDGNLLVDQELMTRLGERPTSIRIRVPFNDVEMVFATQLRYYRGSRLFCAGDGEQATRLAVIKNGEQAVFGPAQPYGPCGESCRDFQERRCKPLGILRCVIEEQQQVGGLYEFRTTSYNSIRNILAGLTMIKATTGGILAWIPLTMRLVPQTVQPKDGKPPNTAYIVQILFEGSPQQLLTTVRDLLALRAPLMQEIRDLESGLKALPAPEEEPDDAADTQHEFYPDLADAGLPGGEESHPAEASAQTVTDEDLRATLMNGIMDALRIVPDYEKAKRRQLLQKAFGCGWSGLKVQSVAQLEVGYRHLQELLQPVRVEGDLMDVESMPDVLCPSVGADVPQDNTFQEGDTSTKSVAEDSSTEQEDASTILFATPEQLDELHRLALQVTPEAAAEVTTAQDRHKGRIPLDLYKTMRNRLITQLGDERAAELQVEQEQA